MFNIFFPLVLQLMIVVTPDWNAVEGTLYCYERCVNSNEWKLAKAPIAVNVGKNGMAWGLGCHNDYECQGLKKVEGDGRSPAGIFSVGPVFGDQFHKSYSTRMHYLLITDDLECVDDPESIYYNKLVYRNEVQSPDWKSSEKMKEIGFLYDLGLVIEHNSCPVMAGKGSAIFMHIWRGKGRGTGGCTAMAESNLNEIVAWLDKDKNSRVVQMPIEEYMRKKEQWGLPELASF